MAARGLVIGAESGIMAISTPTCKIPRSHPESFRDTLNQNGSQMSTLLFVNQRLLRMPSGYIYRSSRGLKFRWYAEHLDAY